MIHLHHDVWTDPVDVASLLAALPVALQALRDLDIDRDGVLPRSGPPRRAGLVVTAGTHPLPGARYRSTEVSHFELEGEQHERRTVTDVELLADEAALGQVRWSQEGSKAVTVASLQPRDAATSLTVDVTGPVRATIEVDLAHLADGLGPQVEGVLLHRFAAAEGTVSIVPDPTGRWRWEVRVEARGRGIVRPVASLGLLLSRKRLHAEFAKAVDLTIGESVQRINDELAQLAAAGSSPEHEVGRAVDRWVDQILVTVPPPGA